VLPGCYVEGCGFDSVTKLASRLYISMLETEWCRCKKARSMDYAFPMLEVSVL